VRGDRVEGEASSEGVLVLKGRGRGKGGRVRGGRVEGEASSEGVLVLKGVSVPREGGAGSFPLVGIEVVSSVLIEGQTPRSIRSWRTILPYFKSAEDRLSSFLILNRRTTTDYPSFFEIREGYRMTRAVFCLRSPRT